MASFVPTQAEIALVNQVLVAADTDKLNLVTGKAAVKVFEGAKLPPHVLGEIWSLADKENNGFLTRSGLATAVRLIGHAQQGEKVKEEVLDRPATKLAHIEGISEPPSQLSSNPSSPSPRSPPPRGSALPPLTSEDKAKFKRLFENHGPVDGLLSGEQARGIFIKSKLPVETLGSIWALADTQNRGALDQADFTIAMYLIQARMSGKLSEIPSALPLGLYEQAGGHSSRGILAQNTGNSASLSPALTSSFPSSIGGSSRYSTVPIPSQYTGPMQPLQAQGTGQRQIPSGTQQPHVRFSPQNTGSILGASAFGQASAAPWDVTPTEKATFDKYFDSLDTQRRGFIDSDVAVPFMLQSQLSQEVLAPVWDLADLNNDGRLTCEGFAIAMHLIQGKLNGKEIPSIMPESLIPPSMRKGKVQSISAPPPSEPVLDLLGDDTPPASPPITRTSPAPPRSILQPQQTGSLSPQPTGFASRSPVPSSDPFTAAFAPSAPAFAAKRDLLSDDEDIAAQSPRVPDNSVEIGNLQNQLHSTNRSLENAKADRTSTDQSVSTQATQLSSLQTQLASAKAAYETETRLLSTLKERFATQASEIQKIREELIRAESDLSAIRVEKSEIEGNLLRDKEDHRELQRKMKEAGEEADRLKASVEKAKKDTKHQKGLLAIAKKQLASREADRAKISKELQEAEQEANETVAELQSAEAELVKEPVPPSPPTALARAQSPTPRADTPSFAAGVPLPSSPSPPGSIMSPASTKSNNPFERLALSSVNSTPRPSSPFAIPSEPAPQAPSPFATSPSNHTSPDVPRSSSPFMHTSADTIPTKPPAEVPRTTSPFMHVVEASIGTAASGESAEDPFGFGDGDGDGDGEEKASDSTGISTPDKTVTTQHINKLADSPMSAEDSFQTAAMSPSSSTAAAMPGERKSTDDAFVDAVSHFPALDEPSANDGVVDNSPDSPELSSRALEIEPEESDSDSDVENEGKPPAKSLATETAVKELVDASAAESGTHVHVVAAMPTVSTPSVATEDIKAGTSDAQLFDDAFGVKPSGEADKQPDNNVLTSNGFDDAFGVKAPSKENVTVPAQEQTSTDLLNAFFTSMTPQASGTQGANGMAKVNGNGSGMNAFDEAMNGIAPAANSNEPKFKLDSTFDDNFDFAAASEANASSAPSTHGEPPAPNGSAAMSAGVFDNAFFPPPPKAEDKKPAHIAPPTSQPQSDKNAFLTGLGMSNDTPSFDDTFGSISSRVSAVPSSELGNTPTSKDAFGSLSSRVSSIHSSTDHGISFDDVFGGGTTRSLGDTLGVSAQTATDTGRQEVQSQQVPFTASPPGSPTSRVPASRSSLRSTSPPPSVSSPRPRPSTGSSSDGGVPPSKAPPTQKRGLSIRLPFGRKDKKKGKNEPPPPSHLSQSSTFLSPAVEEPERMVTPAVEDDVEPVKQLCGMGFSRSQAVTALENHGYNFQKALDSLLRAAPAQ